MGGQGHCRGAAGPADWQGGARPAEGDPDEQRNTAREPPGPAWKARRWIGAALRDAARGLGFGALALAGTALLMALAAPLLLALPLLISVANTMRRTGGPVQAFTVKPGLAPQPVPGPPPAQQLVLAALLLLAGTAVWLLLLPRILRAVRQLAQLTRLLAG